MLPTPADTRKVRLTDIAKQAGVSVPTVSKVLMPSGAGNTRVSEATARKIRRIAKQMHFTPNHAARQLRGKESQMLGVIIDSQAPEIRFHWLQHIELYAAEAGYQLMVGQIHNKPDLLKNYASSFVSRGIEGVFCFAHEYPGMNDNKTSDEIVQTFSQIKNTVFLCEPHISVPELSYVHCDIQQGAEQACQYLLAQGRTRISSIVGDRRHLSNLRRIQGYEAAHRRADVRVDLSRIWVCEEHGLSAQSRAEVADQVVKSMVRDQGADALLASNDLMAVHLLKALKRHGYRVPDDVAVIGYDNLEIGELYEPSLTTIDQNSKTICRLAVEAMLAMIRNHSAVGECRQKVAPRLICRESA